MKTCPACGRISPDEPERCECGITFAGLAERPLFAAAAPPDGPRGMGGWLLFLSFILTILAPLSLGALAVVNVRVSWKLLAPPMRFLVATETMGLLLVAVFVCYAGARLWALDPRGPRLARWALAADPALRLLLIPASFLLATDRNLAWTLLTHAGTQFLRSLPSAIIWISYLNVSKRVAATYDEP